ncbi:MAG: alanine racemase [Anaerovibrio sp.]|uniref:alanine racemase n=1 Tax=Anaerovibrio sp. TaxID=1872532 RepID=UPI0025F69193|nr:alanine racemase [Anaerovibrio sp.]MCR5175434.1 alanine racemase [Anaerovibrio sp.]
MTGRAVWAEINLAALENNIRNIKSCIQNGAKWCAVVKADAYGHGAIEVAKKAVEMGASYLAVAVLSEAIMLRKKGFTVPILILGATPNECARELVAYDITQAIFTIEQAKAISAEAVAQHKTAKVHLKIDTGMHRIGIRSELAGEFAKGISVMPGINLEGIFSHFALADAENKSYAKKQLADFKTAIANVENVGVDIPIKHIANSAAILEMPEAHFDMVRAGIILYGLWPSDEVKHVIELKPVMKLCAKIVYLKKLLPKESISYGCTWTADRESLIGTLPLGYADGYTRMLSGKAQVEYRGQRAPIAGRICMDQCMVDLTDIDKIKEGDTVTLFGSDNLTVDEVAGWLGTINYELPCMISPRVPRVYLGK